ncbi:MAG: NADH-quinone oxidoreductase subunit NuoI [Chloroflexi bacterium]|nr:MAG: NADH-quinone oxidoreductase subunit NuoI [Chloroflexota bacterium]
MSDEKQDRTSPPGGLQPPTSPASGEVKDRTSPPGGLRPPTSPASGKVKPNVAGDVGALLKGLRTTLGEAMKPPVTLMYPEDKTPRSERYRGRHYLRRYDNGLERCIGCELCAAACPVGCILVIAAENTEEKRVSPGERYAKTYEINMLRCIFCGYCEDACPVQAIVLGPEYELSDTSREKFIYTKEKLLEPLPPDVEARLNSKEKK